MCSKRIAYSKLDMTLTPRNLGLAGGILWGLCLFITTLISMFTGYAMEFLSMKSFDNLVKRMCSLIRGILKHLTLNFFNENWLMEGIPSR